MQSPNQKQILQCTETRVLTPELFPTPDAQGSSTGVSIVPLVYTYISDVQGGGEGMCPPVQPEKIIWEHWAITEVENVSCCVEDWA